MEVPDKFRDILPSTSRILSEVESTTAKSKTRKKKDEAAAAEPDTFSALAKLQPDLSGV